MSEAAGNRVRAPLWRRTALAITGPMTWGNFGGWLLFALGMAALMSFGVRSYRIPSPSMEPTLHGDARWLAGDRILVNRWIFGPRIPFTKTRFWRGAEPRRWDIVVFDPPPGSDQRDLLVKRVVGLPGEHVEIGHGLVRINGVEAALPAGMAAEIEYFNDQDLAGILARSQSDEERMYVRTLRMLYPFQYGVGRGGEAYARVPEGHYFVLGDNTLFSIDSRVFGWVPRENLRGRAFAIWWPIGRVRDLSGFSGTWWGRLGLIGIPAALIAWEVWKRRRRGKMAPRA